MGYRESPQAFTPESPLVIGPGPTNPGTPIKGHWSAVATLDFPSIPATGGTQDLTVAVPGAAVGDTVLLGPPTTLNAGVHPYGFVSSAGVVTIRCTNSTDGALDPASATWRVSVLQY
jgi:hypothetical protein